MELIVQNLSTGYGRQILFQNLTFNLASGEILHLSGPNGCGKTTFFRILAGLACFKNGNFFFLKEQKKTTPTPYLHYLSTKTAMRDEFTVRQNFRFWQKFYQNSASNSQIEQWLDQFELEAFYDAPFYSLSTGQKKKLAFLRILLTKRNLWLLDEPFSGLDNHAIKQCLFFIKKHLEQKGLVIFTEHQPFFHYLKEEFCYKKLNLEEFSYPYNPSIATPL